MQDLALLRLSSTQLTRPHFKTAVELVRWLGAVQAQDYSGAKWSLAQRMLGATDAALDQAFADGEILRTHVMRPTWHFVPRDDIRWMLELTAPRVHALSAYMYRQTGLDKALLKRCGRILVKALAGGQQLTRNELAAILERAGIAGIGLRITYIMMHAELEALICSGGRRGKQFTYALLEERAPKARSLKREEALAELCKRYFVSHGPATLQDFTWWSGLTLADAKTGVEMAKKHLAEEEIDGNSYWHSGDQPAAKSKSPQAHLLSTYDEYILSYRDRTHLAGRVEKIDLSQSAWTQFVIIDGKIAAAWRRTFEGKNAVSLAFKPFTTWSKTEEKLIEAETERFGDFLGMQVIIKN